MSFDWSNYLLLAQYLKATADNTPSSEACYRSVVSRAYYAVYCLARNFARNVDDKEFCANEHRALQEHFQKSPHPTRRKLGNQLKKLHQHRIHADYADTLRVPPVNKASSALAQADKIWECLGLLNAVPRTETRAYDGSDESV